MSGMLNHSGRKLAVLIDADNAQSAVLQQLLARISTLGVATVKRIYGDWTTQNMNGWKKAVSATAMQPVQQFRNAAGKNATDSALIIDAMDLLHSGRLDGFCLVTSDSDFTRLATRIRESGLVVYGFGEKKTPNSFVAACDKFIHVESLRGEKASKQQPQPKHTAPGKVPDALAVTTPAAPARACGSSP